jgi:hypothetical protein
VGVVAGAHAILFSELPLMLRTLAALTIVGVGPALLLSAWLTPRDDGSDQAVLERTVFIAALAFTTLTLGMLLLSYLPGGVARWQVLLAYDLAMVGLGCGLWAGRGAQGEGETSRLHHSPFTVHPSHLNNSLARPAPRASRYWLLAGAFILLLLGAGVRLPGLGYAEFHGDEARAVLRASAVIQGEEDVLLLHRKGPVEILTPAALFALTGQLDETSARLPFALAGLAGLFAVWSIGWRLLSPVAGWLAALLLAVTGYYVAFSRFLQYQSVVILTTAAALLTVAALFQEHRAPTRRLLLAALLLATGLLAHYDALAATPALAVLLIAAYIHWRAGRRALVMSALLAGVVGILILALYYVPFLLNPAARATVDYLVGERIGSAPPYNNLGDLFLRGALYNSAYLMALLAGLSLSGMMLVFWRGYGRRWGLLASGVALLASGMLALNGGVWTLNGRDMTVIPAGLLLLLACCAPRLDTERRAVWVWFATAFLAYIFFTDRPRTHVHVFFAPWALIIGDVLATMWLATGRRLSNTGKAWLAVAGAAVMALVLSAYVYQLYVRNDVEVLRTWPVHAPAGFWSPGGIESVDGRFGFPFTNGWKVVGALYAQGKIVGDYETNQRYMWIPDWYTRGQHRCGSTAEWYFAVNSLEPWMEDQTQMAARLTQQGFSPWGVVTVNGDDRMTIYRNAQAGPADATHRFALEDFTPSFDAAATPSLPLAYPAIQERPQHRLDVTFGDEIKLEGYDLHPAGPLRPDQSFRLKLYWRAVAPSTGSHKVSVQSYYGDGVMVAQKDALPVCDREPTTTWDAGELVVDVHDVIVAADAPPGVYPLFVSLYREASGERLPIRQPTGELIDAFQLGNLEIQE